MIRGVSKGGMSSPYSEEPASPYSDNVPSPPTAYNRPYQAVHSEGPYLHIIKQPQPKFRFRYRTELGGAHGQLKANCSHENKVSFPTVKLAKWNNGPALIRLMLVTAEENVNQRKQHIQQLYGENCDEETGICEVIVDGRCDYTARFQKMVIIFIARQNRRDIIMRRKREQLVAHARLRNPQYSIDEIERNIITPADYKRIGDEADEEAKSMDMNKVVLRFQAFQYDEEIESYKAITLPMDSDVVFNLKDETNGKLKIIRMTACSAPCTGGTEIWLLVKKVKRNNVRVRFFELDNNDQEIWSAYGEFTDSDVHQQCTIVLRTPRYRDTKMHTAVSVKVQLERPTDQETSEPLDFTYIPDSLKRSRMHLETALEDGKKHLSDPPAKRFNFSPLDSEAIELSNNRFNGHDQDGSLPTPDILELLAKEYASNPNFNIEARSQSPQHMVPSPVNSMESSNQGLYSPIHPGSTGTPNTEFLTIGNGQLQVPSPGHPVPNSPQYGMMSPGDQSVGSPQFLDGGGGGGGGGLMTQQFSDSQSPQYNSSPSPVRMVPSASYLVNNHLLNQQYLQYPQQQQQQQQQQLQQQQQQQQIQQQQDPQMQLQQLQLVQQTQLQEQQQMEFQSLLQGSDVNINQQPPVSAQPQQIMSEFDLPRCFNLSNNGQETNLPDMVDLAGWSLLDMLDLAGEQLDFGPGILSNLKPDYFGKKTSDSKKKPKEQPLASGKDVDELAKMVSGVRIDDSSRYFLAVQNNQGDTALHTAASNRNCEAFNKILKACEKIKPNDLLNAQNYVRETALHQAVRNNEMSMVRRLVGVPVCNVSIPDAKGNTLLHIAAAGSQDHSCLEALLTRPVNGGRSAISQAINAHNYDGETPLHLAVMSGNLNHVRLLLNAGAQVHECEHKRGANPLHLCAMFGHPRIADYLIRNTNITTEGGLFDGNTALHLAVQGRDLEMCRILVRANADPEAKNCLQRRKKISESEEDEEEDKEEDEEEESEEEPDGCTPIDYAGDNEEILAILRRENVDEAEVVEAQRPEERAETKLPNAQSGIDMSVSDIQSPDDAIGDEEEGR